MSLAAGTSVASDSAARYLSCQCLWLPVASASASVGGTSAVYWLLVPKLPVPQPRLLVSADALGGVRFCAMVAEDITEPVAEDSHETVVEDIHETSAVGHPNSRPSSPQVTECNV